MLAGETTISQFLSKRHETIANRPQHICAIMMPKLPRKWLLGTALLVVLYSFSAAHQVNGSAEIYTAKQQVYSGMGALARLWNQTAQNVSNVYNLVATCKLCWYWNWSYIYLMCMCALFQASHNLTLAEEVACTVYDSLTVFNSLWNDAQSCSDTSSCKISALKFVSENLLRQSCQWVSVFGGYSPFWFQ